jgi:outer membrane receptor protein involved in Fe transport
LLSPDFTTLPPSLKRSEDKSKSVPNSTFGNLAFFAQDEYQPAKRLRLVGCIRFDRFDINSERTPGFDLPPSFTQSQIEDLKLTGLPNGLAVSDTAVSGDFGLVINPRDSVSFTARVGRSFREPNLFERFFTDFGSAAGFVVGNPNLKPESGINVDTGVKFHTAQFAGCFTYFNNTYRNFLTSRPAINRNGAPIAIPTGTARPPIPVFQTVNSGRARIQGFEAEFEAPLKLSTGLPNPFGNVSYLRGDDLESNVALDFITPLQTVIGLRWQDRIASGRNMRRGLSTVRGSRPRSSRRTEARSLVLTHDVRGGITFRREHYRIGFHCGVRESGEPLL